MNGLGFALILGAGGLLVFATLRWREAQRIAGAAEQTLDRAANHLVCAEEWCV